MTSPGLVHLPDTIQSLIDDFRRGPTDHLRQHFVNDDDGLGSFQSARLDLTSDRVHRKYPYPFVTVL